MKVRLPRPYECGAVQNYVDSGRNRDLALQMR